MTMPNDAPTTQPHQRGPDDIASADTYQRGDRVWVWKDHQWRPGIVEDSSPIAVLVTYQQHGGGTGVDSLRPQHIVNRESDEPLDQQGHGLALPLRVAATT
jgi:hypothetical protein